MFRFLCLTALAGAAFGQIPEVPKGDWRCVESKADTALAASGSVQVLYPTIVHCVSRLYPTIVHCVSSSVE